MELIPTAKKVTVKMSKVTRSVVVVNENFYLEAVQLYGDDFFIMAGAVDKHGMFRPSRRFSLSAMQSELYQAIYPFHSHELSRGCQEVLESLDEMVDYVGGAVTFTLRFQLAWLVLLDCFPQMLRRTNKDWMLYYVFQNDADWERVFGTCLTPAIGA